MVQTGEILIGILRIPRIFLAVRLLVFRGNLDIEGTSVPIKPCPSKSRQRLTGRDVKLCC